MRREEEEEIETKVSSLDFGELHKRMRRRGSLTGRHVDVVLKSELGERVRVGRRKERGKAKKGREGPWGR